MPYEVALPDGYVVSDDPARLDRDLVHRFLSEEAYWAEGRAKELTERAIAHSLTFGLYGPGGQAGFARVVSDRTFFAWLSDVFVLPEHRGDGRGLALVKAVMAHPELQGLRRWMLATRDAHGLYVKLGFTAPDPGRLMTRQEPGAA